MMKEQMWSSLHSEFCLCDINLTQRGEGEGNRGLKEGDRREGKGDLFFCLLVLSFSQKEKPG